MHQTETLPLVPLLYSAPIRRRRAGRRSAVALTPFAVAVALLVVAVAPLVVIPEGDLLLSLPLSSPSPKGSAVALWSPCPEWSAVAVAPFAVTVALLVVISEGDLLLLACPVPGSQQNQIPNKHAAI
jgi:hypothetical protein